ncbi:hypothetical protein BGZ68_000133, partial [Mortierella alpina]
NLEEDLDHHNLTENYSPSHHNRYPNDPQASWGDPNIKDYLTVRQDPPMNAPQDYGNSSTEEDISSYNMQRRLDPQDPTRRSTASQLEFYQVRPHNNPQDHGHLVDQDDDTLYQEIQRMRAQQEEYMLRRQSLERVRLEKEAKLRSLAGRANHTLRARD